MTIKSIEFKGVSQATADNYKARLNAVIKVTPDKTLNYVLKHPNKTYDAMLKNYGDKWATITNNIVAILKVYNSNEEWASKYQGAYAIWQSKLEEVKIKQKGADTKKDIDDAVDYNKLIEEIKNPDKDAKTHMQWLLLSIMKHAPLLKPHKDMLGVVRVTNKDEREGDYISITSGKTSIAKMASGVVKTGFADLIKSSMVKFPRKYLFVDKSGNPYKKSNSYFKFVGRTLESK